MGREKGNAVICHDVPGVRHFCGDDLFMSANGSFLTRKVLPSSLVTHIMRVDHGGNARLVWTAKVKNVDPVGFIDQRGTVVGCREGDGAGVAGAVTNACEPATATEDNSVKWVVPICPGARYFRCTATDGTSQKRCGMPEVLLRAAVCDRGRAFHFVRKGRGCHGR